MTAPEHDPALEMWGLSIGWYWDRGLPVMGAPPDMPDRWEGDDS